MMTKNAIKINQVFQECSWHFNDCRRVDVPPCWATGINPLEAYAADDLLAPDCRSLAIRLRKEAGTEACADTSGFG